MALSSRAQAQTGDAQYLAEILARADAEKAYDDGFWRRLLFVRKEWTGEHKSMFDDQEFFLAGWKGKKNRRLELRATIEKFFSPEMISVKKEIKHPQCFFPARWDWLKTRFKLDLKRFPARDCPDVDRFVKFADYDSVSLVFSNYFADNPGSMFGHTLLRLHRVNEEKSTSGLLDDAANFSAMVPVMNPVTYPFKGLFGLFIGRFALLSYSEKIQEYNNYESRDLWEYRLNLSKDEIRRLSLILWELGSFVLNYYYLDENCSFIILGMLEAVRPELELTKRFQIYAIPADTVKAVTRTPGLVSEITFKPSAQTRYLVRASALEKHERKLFLKIIGKFEKTYDPVEFEKLFVEDHCDDNCRVRVIDTLLEFIDFKEKKISIKEVKNWADLRRASLIQRAKLQKPSEPITYRPERSRPDLGHLSSFWELNSGWTNNGYNISDIRWRPALHDLNSNGLGYTDQLQIQVMDTVVRWDQERERADLKRFSFLELTTLGKHELALSPRSWHFEMAYDSRREDDRLFSRSFLEAGFGGARFFNRFGVYWLGNFTGGYSDDSRLFWHFGAGPRLGMLWSFSDRLKWTASMDYYYVWGRHEQEWRTAQSRLNYYWLSEHESFAEFRGESRLYYWGLGHRFFF